ncbi:MAG: S1 RNA-binding domain-containing protein, partial [Pseudomonadota bacterium]|nr:S1 RNA-binding domain-containing protein [Pseudomonadota bacterium]
MITVSPSVTDVNESFASLFEESLSHQEMRIGEVITAEVVHVDNDEVIVNAGLKSESIIPASEFRNDRGELEVKVGDFVSVAIDALEDGYGSTR